MKDELRKGGEGLTLAIEFILVVGGLTWLGAYLDGRWDTSPWLVLAGMVLGLSAGIYNILKSRLFKDEVSNDDPKGSD